MNKAIYGLAMPFNDSYVDYLSLARQFTVEKTNKESVEFGSLIPATINHDYTKVLGDNRSNLTLGINDNGIYFKLIPNTKLGHETYIKVKNRLLRHCSISYLVEHKERDYAAERKLRMLSKILGWNDTFRVYSYLKVIVQEVSIGNNPANKDTFCTTNKKHPRLKGVEWYEHDRMG
jgi:phage head maturation protease